MAVTYPNFLQQLYREQFLTYASPKGTPMCDLKVGDRVQITGMNLGTIHPTNGHQYLGQLGTVFRVMQSMLCPFPEIKLDSGEVRCFDQSHFIVLPPPAKPAWTFTCPQCTVTLVSETPVTIFVPDLGHGLAHGTCLAFQFRLELTQNPVHYANNNLFHLNAESGLESAKFKAIELALTMAHNRAGAK